MMMMLGEDFSDLDFNTTQATGNKEKPFHKLVQAIGLRWC